MRKFLLKVLLFVVCLSGIDLIAGFCFSWLRSHAKGGSTANCEYIANHAEEEIIILGSSRATHHYIPEIIEDSLELSCYNCGEEGNGVVLAYGRLKMLTERYKPKLILYEITPGYDYGMIEPDSKYLGYLRAYYSKNGIPEIFDDFEGKLSRLKMLSKMYQNTQRLLQDILDNIVYRDNRKGFSPLFGQIDIDKLHSEVPHESEKVIDSLKLSYVEKVINLAKGNDIPILFMISPRYGNKEESNIYEPAFSLCMKYGVPVYDYRAFPGIADNYAFFQDEGHMNQSGAVAYTNMLVKEVLPKYLTTN